MNKRLVLLNPKFINQKRLGTAPAGSGGRPPQHPSGSGVYSANMGQTEQLSQVNEGQPENLEEGMEIKEENQNAQDAEGGEINVADPVIETEGPKEGGDADGQVIHQDTE